MEPSNRITFIQPAKQNFNVGDEELEDNKKMNDTLAHKLAKTTLETQYASTLNWKKNRIVTVGNTLVVKDETKKKKLISQVEEKAVLLFEEKEASQGLILSEGRAEAASVTTEIKNIVPRKIEKYQTFIQFESATIKDEGADFKVNRLNHLGKIFYSGCHLIDYQFITSTAHTERNNYFPGNYFYNMSLKNWLVKPERTAAYVEIPVYSENPPFIEAKRNQGRYPIPICIFFVRISTTIQNGKNQIVIYCFPNNRFDYEETKQNLNLNRFFAAQMCPCFELNPSLYPLFQPAIIHTLQTKQLEKEPALAEQLNCIINCLEGEGDISKLSQQIWNSDLDPELILPNCERILSNELTEVLYFAGEFMLKHAISNILKSEVFSIKARVAFIDTWMQFALEEKVLDVREVELIKELGDEVGPSDDFKELLLDEFERTLDDLPPASSELNEENLILLAYINLKMTIEQTFPRHPDLILLCGNDVLESCEDSISTLELLVSRNPKNFSDALKESWLRLIFQAQETYLRLKEWALDDGEQLGSFLYNQRPLCLELLQELTLIQGKTDLKDWVAKIETIGATL